MDEKKENKKEYKTGLRTDLFPVPTDDICDNPFHWGEGQFEHQIHLSFPSMILTHKIIDPVTKEILDEEEHDVSHWHNNLYRIAKENH